MGSPWERLGEFPMEEAGRALSLWKRLEDALLEEARKVPLGATGRSAAGGHINNFLCSDSAISSRGQRLDLVDNTTH